MKKINFSLVEKYIFECIDFSEYQKQPTTKAGQISYLLEICEREKRYNKYPTKKAMFVDWCYGLPTCFKQDYINHAVTELFVLWGLKLPKNDYQLFDVFYGFLFDSVNYLNTKLNK